jgi:hypothetical protein
LRDALEALPNERPGRERRAKRKPSAATRWTALLFERQSPRARLFVIFALAVTVAVPVNALFLQDGRHPAPLFRDAKPLAVPPAPEHPKRIRGQAMMETEAPKPPQRPAALAPAKPEAKPASGKADAGKQAAKPIDQIAQLLGGGLETKTAKPEAAAKPADKNVLTAQRALAKLGFALHVDGVLGGTTREAIEKFERANGMPVKGELTPKILKLLGQRAGVALR